MLFFQCMAGLFNPANRRRDGVKWGLVSYTVAMFSFSTVLTGMSLHIQSLAFIDNRDYPGTEGIPPGPLGYGASIYQTALSLTPSIMFFMTYWLADGLLVGSLFGLASTHPGV